MNAELPTSKWVRFSQSRDGPKTVVYQSYFLLI